MRSTLTAAILFAAVLGVNAQTMNLKADIPFDFVVGSKTMPAGVYDVSAAIDFEPDPSMVQQDAQGTDLVTALREPIVLEQ